MTSSVHKITQSTLLFYWIDGRVEMMITFPYNWQTNYLVDEKYFVKLNLKTGVTSTSPNIDDFERNSNAYLSNLSTYVAEVDFDILVLNDAREESKRIGKNKTP